MSVTLISSISHFYPFFDLATSLLEQVYNTLAAVLRLINTNIANYLILLIGFALIQFHRECYCGDSYVRYGELPNSSCNCVCDGDGSQICGAFFTLSVYYGKYLTMLYLSPLKQYLNLVKYHPVFVTVDKSKFLISNFQLTGEKKDNESK